MTQMPRRLNTVKLSIRGMRAEDLISEIGIYPPRYGPEWGSGGVFGLRYHRGVLYFTLAFEGEAHFITAGGHKVYRFEQLGRGPASGGDTYNAVECVDEYIYFGGWVHKPARFKGKEGFIGEILFYDKYSHVHEYDADEDRIRLLWSDTIRHETKWAGEVSEIIYDPVNDSLLIARGDGHENLGVYRLDRRSGKAERISKEPALKGSLFLDYACFDIKGDSARGIKGIQCLDLVSGKWYVYEIEEFSKISVDGGDLIHGLSGCAIEAYTRYFHFVKGGVLVGNPVEPDAEPVRFVRLFDFGKNPYAPIRTNALPLGGGVLVAFNAYTHGVLHPPDDMQARELKLWNYVAGPSVLLYIMPPQVRVVAVLGARVTSMAKMGGYLLLGYSTTPNLSGRDATPIDAGLRGILVLRESELLLSGPQAASFRVSGEAVGDRTFGGIPLYGYREPMLVVYATRSNTLEIHEYDLGLPPQYLGKEAIKLRPGRNVIDISGFRNIVSFRMLKTDNEAKVYVFLR